MHLAVVVTCKNRLAHLKQTAPKVIQSAGAGILYVLVDWGCPEGSGSWLSKTFPSHLYPNVRALRIEAPGFWKTRAQNLGAHEAIRLGADYLLFSDADTLLEPPFFSWLTSNLRRDLFCFVEPKLSTKDLTGLLAVPAWAFQKVGGFDEGFRQYGHEDIELRIRLWKLLGLGFGTYHHDLVGTAIRGIPHGDDLRVQHYPEKDLSKSVNNTLHQLIQKISNVLGHNFLFDYNGEYGPVIRFLMGVK